MLLMEVPIGRILV